jgi:hypothetical protein
MTLDELNNLEVSLDDAEILNDLRVVIPHYFYNIEYDGETPIVTYIDLVGQSVGWESIRKYGRRTKIQKYQVMNAEFEEAYCENNKQKYAEPLQKATAKIIGSTDEKIAQCFGFELSQQHTLVNSDMELNDTFRVDNIVLEIRDGNPVVTLGLGECGALELINLFVIDTDLIDGENVIG